MTSLSLKIGKLIILQNKSNFSGRLENTKNLWERVHMVKGKSRQQQSTRNFTTSDLIAHYADVSTDKLYVTFSTKPPNDLEAREITEFKVFRLLDTLRATSLGRTVSRTGSYDLLHLS